MIRAVFFDADGTLLSFNTHKIPDSTIRSLDILRSRGIKVFVATGRHISELKAVQDTYDFDGYLSLNGQYCFDNKGNVIHKLVIDKADIEASVQEAKKNIFPCYFVHETGQFINMVDDSVLRICNGLNLSVPPVENPDIALDMDIYQLSAYLSAEDEHMLLDKLKNVEKARWHGDFIDIIPAGGGKHHGVEKVLDHYGISMKEAMAFGDGENDISMLMAVNIGVAMGNANDTVKLASDYVTDHVDRDGIEKALIYFSLIG